MIAEANSIVLNSQHSGAVINWMNEIESKIQTIIDSIPAMDDEALMEVYEQANILGRCAWKVQMAATDEMLSRAERIARGRKDKDGVGREAVAQKLSKQIGVKPKQILEDAGIYETFLKVGRTDPTYFETLDHLTEKGFFRAAYYSDDPHTTLEYFAQQKANNPYFSVNDARRVVKEQKTPPLDTPVPPLIEDEPMRSWWERFADVLAGAPERPGLRRLLNNISDEVRGFVQRPSTTRRNQILDLIREGIDEHDLIAREIGVDRIQVATWLNKLCEEDILVQFEKEAIEGARGQRRTGYRILEEQCKK